MKALLVCTLALSLFAAGDSRSGGKIKSSHEQHFSDAVSETTNGNVSWLVDRVAGGDATSESISASGLYTAPAATGSHKVMVASAADPTRSAGAIVNVQPASSCSNTAVGSVRICAPGSGFSVASPVQFISQANSSKSISSNWVYVDNAVVYKNYHTPSVNASLTVAGGSHSLRVQTWDSGGALFKAQVNITVQAPPPPTAPTLTFSASPSSINTGGTAALQWTTTNTSSLTIDNGVGSVQPVASGSANVSPAATVTYTATAIGGANQSVTARATVIVNGVPPPPPPPNSVSIAVDFGSRNGAQPIVPADMFGAQYAENLPDSGTRGLLLQAGFHVARTYANVPGVYATKTPDWSKIDPTITKLRAAGLSPILEVAFTPSWLAGPTTLCPGNPQYTVPSDLNAWAQIAASFVAHFDQAFPGFVQDYEIWNEPDTQRLCSSDHLADYLDIYAAAAPAMKAQASKDGATIRVGGDAGAGPSYPELLTDPRTAPYVDFYSYHLYVSGPPQTKAGMTWNGANGTPSLLNLTLGLEQSTYMKAVAHVKNGKTPLGAKTPIYFSEYNDNWWFQPDCCRNSPIFSPLWNTITVAELLNSVYVGSNQVPTKMVYYAAANRPFCIIGLVDISMDCSSSPTGGGAGPYPQWYAFQLMARPGFLDMGEGGNMATAVSLSSTAKQSGIVATAFYTKTQDSILIINPTAVTMNGLTLQANNIGKNATAATLLLLNASNPTIHMGMVSLSSVQSGVQASFDLPAFSVIGIAINQQ